MDIERIKHVDLYRNLYLTRHYDETLRELASEGLWNFYHGIIGEEAIPVGVCAALQEDDYVVPVHRTQLGVMVSRGISLERLTAELFGREGGFCNGVSGTHTACMEKGVLSKTGILGAGLPIAVGVALAIKLRKTKRVVAVFIGDGASSSGNFHEALNMASIWNLPVIFVLENNKYAWTTPTDYALAVKQLSVRASAYGIPGYTIDGNDLLKVYETSLEAVERSRNGEGPSLLECKTYRIMGHYGPGMDYELKYRTDEEIYAWKKRDPLKNYRKFLVEIGVTERELQSIEEEAKIKVKKAVEFAIDSSFPSEETVLRLCKTEAQA